MASTKLDVGTAVRALEVVEELAAEQRTKVRELARRIRPELRDEDLRRASDLAELSGDATFQRARRQLAALLAAAIALRSQLLGATVARG